ncbi:hypothetical protein DID77_02390, partial [Candidatus Marinamargulisbacteria bacterium SCGC AG-439-L15]
MKYSLYLVLGITLFINSSLTYGAEPKPAAIIPVGIEEKIQAKLPETLSLYNTNNQEVQFKTFFMTEKPTIISLVYYTCPMLCHLLLDGLKNGLKE